MADLKTKYMGLELENPIIIGSSGLTSSSESIVQLAKHGASAVVLKSLFEEEIQYSFRNTLSKHIDDQDSNLEFFDYYDYKLKDDMFNKTTSLIQKIKEKVDIPVIASINCRSIGEWYAYAAHLEKAGADAIELNIFQLPASVSQDASAISDLYLKIVSKIKSVVSIPISVKMSPYLTDMAAMANKLNEAGANGLVMFNRYFNPDIDLANNKIISGQVYSGPEDYSWTLRWISILSPEIKADLVASTGIHNHETIIKMLLSGAAAVQIVSAIYKNGPAYIRDLLYGLEKWMDDKELNSIKALNSYGRLMMPKKPEIFERVQFMRYFGEHE